MYGLLLGVLLPWTVGKWWYGTQRLTKEKVLRASASKLVTEFDDELSDGDMVNVLSSGAEYDETLAGKAENGIGKIESKLEQNIVQDSKSESPGATLAGRDHKKLQSFEGVRRKAAALLWSYLGRIQLDGGSLDEGRRTPLKRLSPAANTKQRNTTPHLLLINFLTPWLP